MNPRVVRVKALQGHCLDLEFSNGEQRVFDCNPYLALGVFQPLNDESRFSLARVEGGTVVWPGDLDICPDTLYVESRPASKHHAA
jgi:hypothetical protein